MECLKISKTTYKRIFTRYDGLADLNKFLLKTFEYNEFVKKHFLNSGNFWLNVVVWSNKFSHIECIPNWEGDTKGLHMAVYPQGIVIGYRNSMDNLVAKYVFGNSLVESLNK